MLLDLIDEFIHLEGGDLQKQRFKGFKQDYEVRPFMKYKDFISEEATLETLTHATEKITPKGKK